MCIAWKAQESLKTVISPAAIRNLNTFPSLVKSKVLLLAIMSANGQSKRVRIFHFLRRPQAGMGGGGRGRERMVSEIYPLPLPHLHSNHVLQYGVWKVDMGTSPAPICSNTKSKIFLTS